MRELIESCIAGGSIYYNSNTDFSMEVKWYVDENTEIVGHYFDEYGNVNPAPANAKGIIAVIPIVNEVYDEIANKYVNLAYAYFSITTAIKPTVFKLKATASIQVPLLKDQQIVRWYIPASLIPIRTVYEKYDDAIPPNVTGVEIINKVPIRACYTVGLKDNFVSDTLTQDYVSKNMNAAKNGYYFYTNDWHYNGIAEDDATVAIFTPNKANPYYYYQEDMELYELVGSTYVKATSYVPTKQYYSKEEYFDQNAPGYLTYKYLAGPIDSPVVTLRSTGSPYIPAGTIKTTKKSARIKTNNVTKTYDFVKDIISIDNMEQYLLGNNGRIEVKVGSISVQKQWYGKKLENVQVQLYANGVPFRDPVELNAANNWKYKFKNLLPYELSANSSRQSFSYNLYYC